MLLLFMYWLKVNNSPDFMSDPVVSPSFFCFPQVLREETLRLNQESDIILQGATSEVRLKFLSLLWLNSFDLGKIMFFIFSCTLMMQDRSYFIVMVFVTYEIVDLGIMTYV